ncbi:MAG: tetratricopeptide repeat protein [Chloroflexaceae bacterium]
MTVASAVEPFSERIERLLRELERAIKWQRPAILLAVYSSEFVRADAETALKTRLSALGQTVSDYRVTGADNADIPLHLRELPDQDRTVFFVSGLRWGDGADGRNAYRALNIRREYFVDARMRVIFWLTQSEAEKLPAYAPDFWAFRHRVVEFVEAPQPEQIRRTAWDVILSNIEIDPLHKNIDAKIALREALLHDLPAGDETLDMRATLLLSLAGLYVRKAGYDRALDAAQAVLEIVEQFDRVEVKVLCLTLLGEIYRLQKNYDAALIVLNQALALDANDAAIYKNLGDVYRDTDQYAAALTAYQQALALDPENPSYYRAVSNVYQLQGDLDQATMALQRAITLNPQDHLAYLDLGFLYHRQERYADAVESCQQALALNAGLVDTRLLLAVCYQELNQKENALQQIELARDSVTADTDELPQFYLELFNGNMDTALDLLKAAFEKGQISRKAFLNLLFNTPAFNDIRDTSYFQELLNAAQE